MTSLSRLTHRSRLLLQNTLSPSNLHHRQTFIPLLHTPPLFPSSLPPNLPLHRLFSTLRRPTRPKSVDIGARARQLQNRRLWTYALTFSCIAGFIIIVLNNFQDQLVFYVTPTDALEKFTANPSKNRFRLGGLVLEGSLVQPASSPHMEFVVTDLITDILVRYQGSLPDLFREGHSVVVEGFIKSYTDDNRETLGSKKNSSIAAKARTLDCYFSATEVLAKHDEKYMPQEVAAAIERNKAKLEADALAVAEAGDANANANANADERNEAN